MLLAVSLCVFVRVAGALASESHGSAEARELGPATQVVGGGGGGGGAEVGGGLGGARRGGGGGGNDESDDLPNSYHFSRLAEKMGLAICIVEPDDQGGDDAPAIMDALNNRCRTKSIVFLPGPVYNIRSNMTTLDLDDVTIVQYGRMLWSGDVDYWLSVSMPIGFQNQSTVWYFGGNDVEWDGYHAGTLDGNGQVWYDWAQGRGNLPRRPMNINFQKLRNSVVKRLRFVQSQMWTMAITDSSNVDLEDIYVNSTSSSRWSTLNTDGADTIRSDRITFSRWFVTNGDDSIALKGNSTRIRIYDSVFCDGQGIAIGSVGQFKDEHEVVSGFRARNITFRNTAHATYMKTWAGHRRGYPPNGGGGGLGSAHDVVVEDVKMEGLRQQPIYLWQCENYSGHAGEDCNSSLFNFSNFRWRGLRGTVRDNVVHTGWFQCSAASGGCHAFKVSHLNVTKTGSGERLDRWHCENMSNHSGFSCDTTEAPPMAAVSA